MLRRLHSRLLAVALAMAVPAVPAAETPAPVPFKLGPGHSILIPVKIGEDGPFRFVLDTGSSRSAISMRVAARLSAPVVARSKVISWGSPAPRAVVRLPTMAVGDVRKRGILATVFGASELRALAGQADGILGMDFLADQPYTLDYRRRLLSWGATFVEGARDSIHLRVRWSEGRCLVGVSHPAGGRLWLVADSGTDTVVLFRSRERRLLPALHLNERVMLDTVGGRWMADRVLVRELRLGALTLRHVPAIQMPAERDRSVEGDGLLPLYLFAQVMFDPASASMIVVPR